MCSALYEIRQGKGEDCVYCGEAEMKPYFETKLGKLYNCDCLDYMETMEDKSVDLVLTDPPYNASNSNIGFKKGYKTINEDWDKNFNPLEFMIESDRIIRDGGGHNCFLLISYSWELSKYE